MIVKNSKNKRPVFQRKRKHTLEADIPLHAQLNQFPLVCNITVRPILRILGRPLRLEFSGTLFHVTARGNERRNIFLGNLDDDRRSFLGYLGKVCERFN